MANAGISPSLVPLSLLMAERLVVGGLTPFTTIDFPGRLAAVVFCQGCPWRCGYCHNQHLQPPQGDAQQWNDVRDWLISRQGLLDAVVFSGGEPLLQRGLTAALNDVRRLGFATGLHTAGIYPQRLAAALPLLDWVGLDIKGPFADYPRITGGGSGEAARQALALLRETGTAHEIRCTVDTSLLDADDMERMADELADLGASQLLLQACRLPGQSPHLPETLITAAARRIRVEVREV